MTTDTDKPTGDHAELVALLRIQAAFPQDPRHRAVTLKAADALEAQGKKIAELAEELARWQQECIKQAGYAEKAEAALRECMAHADAMSDYMEKICFFPVDCQMAYRQWRADHDK